jgi:hypothetical protein
MEKMGIAWTAHRLFYHSLTMSSGVAVTIAAPLA